MLVELSPPAPRRASGDVSVVDQLPGEYFVGKVGPYLVLLLRQHLGSRGVAAVERASEEVLRQHDRLGHMVILYPEHGAPGPDERAGISRVLRRFRGSIAGVAVVREGGGLRAAITRSAMNAINLLAQTQHPAHVFADVGSATVWLESHLRTGTIDAAHLRQAVREFRDQFS